MWTSIGSVEMGRDAAGWMGLDRIGWIWIGWVGSGADGSGLERMGSGLERMGSGLMEWNWDAAGMRI